MKLSDLHESRYAHIPDNQLKKSLSPLKKAEIYLATAPKTPEVVAILNLGNTLDKLSDEANHYFELATNAKNDEEYAKIDKLKSQKLKEYQKLAKEYDTLLSNFAKAHKDIFGNQKTSPQSPSTSIEDLIQACNSWIALEHSPEDIKLILSHPLSKNLNTIDSQYIYRAVFVAEDKFEKTGQVKVKAQDGNFIAYSASEDWASVQVRSDFDYSGDILTFKKDFHQDDCLLNFSALIKKIQEETGELIYSSDEQEVWMKATQYYKTCVADELVNVDYGG